LPAPRNGLNWDASARIYSEVAPQISFYRETAAMVVAAASVKSNMIVADVGSGSAGIVEAEISRAAPEIGKIYCVDSSAAMLRELQRNCRAVQIQAIHSKIEAMSALIPPMDRIICNAAIWNFDIPAALREVRRTLKPLGKFAFTISEWDLDYWGKSTHPKYKVIDDELRRRALPPKPFRGSEKKLRLERLMKDLEAARLSLFSREEFEVETACKDYKLFYRIPSIARKSLPQVPLKVALDVLAVAIDRLPPYRLPPVRWMVFEVGMS